MKNHKDASVIGLGMMGVTLARLLLRAGYRVTVWNRTLAKAGPLAREGAIVARTAAAAIAASAHVVICVHDYKAAYAILETPDVASNVAGRVLVQLTTGSPREARESEAWSRERGADYLDGAIQAAPSQMGRPDTAILVSGTEAAFRRSESLLLTFGGNVTYLGEPVGAASAMDLATLSYVYGSVLGFLHGVRVCEEEGFRVDTYGSIVNAIAPSFGEFLKHEGDVIQKGDYTVSESPLKISAEATARLVDTAREAGIDTAFPAFAAELFREAMARGYGDEEAAALIKVLRATAQPR